MSPRTGRPPTGNARQTKVETRMTKEEIEKLDFCCKATGKSRSEIVRDGIDVIYAKLNNLTEE